MTQSSDAPNAEARRFRAVLLDDSADDRDHFLRLLRRHPSLHLVGTAETLKEALALIAKEGADVLFLDVEIGGKNLFEECALVPPAVKMVFLTRSREGAVRAFELDALDYLIKPLEAVRLSETVRRLLRIEWPKPSPAPEPAAGTLLIPFERGRRGASLDEICLIQAFGNYTRLSLSDGRSEIVLRSLAKWEGLLPMPPFLRTHRNTIVHAGRVRGLEEAGEASVLRVEHVGEPVPVSRRCLPEVRQALFAGNP